jgi:hypothetical protein
VTQVVIAVAMMAGIAWLLSWVVRSMSFERAIHARMAAMDVAASRFAETCPICLGSRELLCPLCGEPITQHTHENDYLCDCAGRSTFVNPVRASDGQRVSGDGAPGPLRYLS